jgi:hypothetical protein
MNQSLDSRSLFLEEFIKRLIIKSRVQPKIEKRVVLLEKLEEVVVSPPRLEIEHKKIEPVRKIEQVIAKKPEKPIITSKTIEISAAAPKMPQIKPIIPQAKPMMPPTPQMPKITIMERLTRIFADPGVQMLNCPGPNKNILITRLGMVQTSQLSFNENEIKEFMNELSEKTRIPLIPGLIKVIFQNLIITAVVSEFVGTKFVAERRPQLSIQTPPRIQFR